MPAFANLLKIGGGSEGLFSQRPQVIEIVMQIFEVPAG